MQSSSMALGAKALLSCTCFVEGRAVGYVYNAAIQTLEGMDLLMNLLGVSRHHKQVACKGLACQSKVI